MTRASVWKGTAAELQILLDVLAKHCSCVSDSSGRRVSSCPPHKMCCDDQRALDGLLYARRMADQFVLEEFTR